MKIIGIIVQFCPAYVWLDSRQSILWVGHDFSCTVAIVLVLCLLTNVYWHYHSRLLPHVFVALTSRHRVSFSSGLAFSYYLLILLVVCITGWYRPIHTPFFHSVLRYQLSQFWRCDAGWSVLTTACSFRLHAGLSGVTTSCHYAATTKFQPTSIKNLFIVRIVVTPSSRCHCFPYNIFCCLIYLKAVCSEIVHSMGVSVSVCDRQGQWLDMPISAWLR